MRKLLFAVAILCPSLGAAPAFVQAKVCTQTVSGASFTCAYTANVAANDLLVVLARWDDATAATATFSSSAGVTCTWNTAIAKFRAGDNNNPNQAVQEGYCIVPSAGAETVKITLSASRPYIDMSIMEYSGISTTTPLDKVAAVGTLAQSPSSSTACSSGATAALAQTGELAIGSCSGWNNTQTWGAVSGWTNETTASDTVLGVYDSTLASASAVTFSKTLTAADDWTATVSTWIPSGAAPSTKRAMAVVY